MTQPNDIVLKALSALLGQMAQETPELKAIMDKAKNGEIDETGAMQEMMRLIQSHPDLEAKVLGAAVKTLAPLQGQEASLPSHGTALPDLLTRNPTSGLPRLNPLYEAALAERIQFDGDVPEHRFGPLPPGAKAAVPVKTDARNTAALGAMLKKASEEVTKAVEEHQAGRAKMIEGIVSGDQQALEIIQKHGELITMSGDSPDIGAMNYGSPETDLAVYRRHEVPKSVAVTPPSGSELAKMTPEEQRQESFRFLSTTQGRRTAIQIIRQIIAGKLDAFNWDVTERDFDPKAPKEEPLASAEWIISISGPGATQAAFSTIDVASRALTSGLLKKLGEAKPETRTKVFLEVISIDTVDVRSVGWAVRMLKG